MTRRTALVLTAIATVLPLWTVRYLPGTDLPSHLAIASILAKLVAHDPVTSQFYAINLQPVPYYLVYVVLAPLVAFFGPFIAAKLFCSVVAIAIVLATHRLFRALQSPWWAVTSALFLTYGMIFFWGFLPTLIGVPVFIYGLACLIETARFDRRSSAIAASLTSVVLMLTHAALIIPWGCALIAMCCTGKRTLIRRSVLIGLASFALLMPFIVMRLLARHEGYAFSVQYEAWHIVGRHVVQQFAVFDRGLGFAAHVMFIAAAWLLALRSPRAGRIDAATRRMVLAFAGLSSIAYIATPMAVDAGGDFIWALNVRLFFAAELGVLAAMTLDRDGVLKRRDFIQPLLASAHLAALLVFFSEFDATARGAEPVLAAIPPGATMAVASKDGRYADAWPPQLLHIHGYYLASEHGYDGAVFTGKHIPIVSPPSLCPGNMPAPKPTACAYLFAEGSAVEPALRDCTPVAVSGTFALVRDCLPPSETPSRDLRAHQASGEPAM